MKLLVVSLYWPPAGGPGVQRPLKLAGHLAAMGHEVHVLAPDDPKWLHVDRSQTSPPGVVVHRARNLGPRARRPAEELRLARGLDRLFLRTGLLIPEAEGRGRGVLSGKVFEYLAAGRPILAAVPPDGEAAALLEEVGAGIVAPPDDATAIAAGLRELVDRWRGNALEPVVLAPEHRRRLDRRSRAEELEALLLEVAR